MRNNKVIKVLALIMAVCLLTACSGNIDSDDSNTGSGNVTTDSDSNNNTGINAPSSPDNSDNHNTDPSNDEQAPPAEPTGDVGPRANTAEDPANGVYVSESGNDSTANGSIGAPYKSINTALAAAGPGDTIVLRGGTYREGINVRVRIPDITIKSAKGEWAVIDLTTFDTGAEEDSGVYFDVDSSGGKLQCVEVMGGFYAVCM